MMNQPRGTSENQNYNKFKVTDLNFFNFEQSIDGPAEQKQQKHFYGVQQLIILVICHRFCSQLPSIAIPLPGCVQEGRTMHLLVLVALALPVVC